MRKKIPTGHHVSKCCDIKVSKNVPDCDLVPPVFESLVSTVHRLKSNPYMTKEVWQAKNICVIDADLWYSYADIDSLFNN